MDTTAARGPTAAPARTRQFLAAGALAGLLGAASAIVVMVLAALIDDRPLEMALRPLVAYLDGDGAALVLLAALQLAVVAAVLGVALSSFLPYDLPLGGAAVAGSAYALAAMAFLTSAADELQSTMAPLGGSWVIAFGVFGAVLAVAPALRRRWSGRVARGAAAPAAGAPRASSRRDEAPA